MFSDAKWEETGPNTFHRFEEVCDYWLNIKNWKFEKNKTF